VSWWRAKKIKVKLPRIPPLAMSNNVERPWIQDRKRVLAETRCMRFDVECQEMGTRGVG
jgi:hypothetical protein